MMKWLWPSCRKSAQTTTTVVVTPASYPGTLHVRDPVFSETSRVRETAGTDENIADVQVTNPAPVTAAAVVGATNAITQSAQQGSAPVAYVTPAAALPSTTAYHPPLGVRPLSVKGSASALSIRDLVADLRELAERAPRPSALPSRRGSHNSVSTKPRPPPPMVPPTRSQSIREMVQELKELSLRAPPPGGLNRGAQSSRSFFSRPPPTSASVPCVRVLAAAETAEAGDYGRAGSARDSAPSRGITVEPRSPQLRPFASPAMPRTTAMLGLSPWRQNPLHKHVWGLRKNGVQAGQLPSEGAPLRTAASTSAAAGGIVTAAPGLRDAHAAHTSAQLAGRIPAPRSPAMGGMSPGPRLLPRTVTGPLVLAGSSGPPGHAAAAAAASAEMGPTSAGASLSEQPSFFLSAEEEERL
jgi:hypothetical protein